MPIFQLWVSLKVKHVNHCSLRSLRRYSSSPVPRESRQFAPWGKHVVVDVQTSIFPPAVAGRPHVPPDDPPRAADPPSPTSVRPTGPPTACG